MSGRAVLSVIVILVVGASEVFWLHSQAPSLALRYCATAPGHIAAEIAWVPDGARQFLTQHLCSLFREKA